MRALDQRTIDAGTPGELLMERAGFAVARVVAGLLPPRESRAVLLLAGKGNNGGDAFVAARHLAAAGCAPTLVLLARRHDLQGDALTHFQQLVGVEVIEQPALDQLEILVDQLQPAVVIDGLLGTGLTGEVREPFAAVIRFCQSLPARVRPAPAMVAIDIPSGLDSDTGAVHGVAVRADETVTMGLPKIGLLRPAALEYVGHLTVVDLGFRPEFVAETPAAVEMIAAADLRLLFPPRPRAAHKGDFGHLLVVAGSEGYTGAPVLCARAAARAGAGLVTLAVPRAFYPIVAAACPPEIMPRPFDDWTDLLGNGAARSGGAAATSPYDALALGPGLGQDPQTQQALRQLVARATIPTVIDADGLNALGADLDALRQAKAPLVLTPHPGEMARLIGKTTQDVQADRWGIARGFARDYRVTLALKGAGTVVAEPDGPLWVNLTGNPGLARGGMGDVLTGLIGAFLAQGFSPGDATRASVFVHGSAGDLACDRHGEIALQAGDLIDCLGEIFRRLQGDSLP